MEGFGVQLSPFGADLPLVGAARHVPPGHDSAVVLDFGGTWVKRAWAAFEDDRLVELRRLPDQAAPWRVVRTLEETTPEEAEKLLRDMAALIAATWQGAPSTRRGPAETIPVSLAAYVRDGNPMLTQAGTYMQTNRVTDNLERELGRRVGAALDRPVRIRLLHDGTAAAATYAGERQAAVIMLGTALGVGFPGDGADLRGMMLADGPR